VVYCWYSECCDCHARYFEGRLVGLIRDDRGLDATVGRVVSRRGRLAASAKSGPGLDGGRVAAWSGRPRWAGVVMKGELQGLLDQTWAPTPPATAYVECRNFGTTLDPNATRCPACQSDHRMVRHCLRRRLGGT